MLPNIKRAALLIAYDNGMINRKQSEEQYLELVEKAISEFSFSSEEIDTWLLSLTNGELNTICCGEVSDAQFVLEEQKAPAGTVDLLDRMFDL